MSFSLFNWDTLPDEIGLAFSGGVDSVFALDFLLKANKKVTIIHFKHENDLLSNIEYDFANRIAKKYNLPIILGINNNEEVRRKKSPEQFWRDMRYKFLHSIDMIIVSGHHLDDCLETYIMSSAHGTAKVIPYANNNVVRPFLLVKKQSIYDWCEKYKLDYISDPSNSFDMSKNRNRVRKYIVPEMLKINPGMHKVITKIIINRETMVNQVF